MGFVASKILIHEAEAIEPRFLFLVAAPPALPFPIDRLTNEGARNRTRFRCSLIGLPKIERVLNLPHLSITEWQLMHWSVRIFASPVPIANETAFQQREALGFTAHTH